MHIPVRCPHCNTVLQVPEAYAGQTGKCQHCQGSISVPSAAVPVFEGAPPKNAPRQGFGFFRSIIGGFGGCLGVGFAIIFIGGCIFALGSSEAAKNAKKSTTPADTSGYATLEKFNRIQTGMPLHQVERIIGRPGETVSDVTIGAGTQFETSNAIYTFRAANGIANMTVQIQNGHVIGKSQIALE